MNEEKYTDFWGGGVYKCSKCGTPLFESGAKFSTRGGSAFGGKSIWPSFRSAMDGSISTKPDDSLGMHRTEILCAKCGEHLGHVFQDGKIIGDTHPEAGARYCVLSDALDFEEKK